VVLGAHGLFGLGVGHTTCGDIAALSGIQIPTTTPGAFDAANALSSAPSIAARFPEAKGADALTSAARAVVAVTASSAIVRQNARGLGARKRRCLGIETSWIRRGKNRRANAV
jgi:hypothetical protein